MRDETDRLDGLKAILSQYGPSIDDETVTSLTLGIDGAVIALISDRRGGIEIRQEGGTPTFKQAARRISPSAALARLDRTSRGSTYAWQKAWQEAPREIIDLLIHLAGGPDAFAALPHVRTAGFVGAVPSPGAVYPLLTEALQVARTWNGRPPEELRDRAVIAILRAFRRLTGRPLPALNTEKLQERRHPLIHFVEAIEAHYTPVSAAWGCPLGMRGFGILNSGHTASRLTALASEI